MTLSLVPLKRAAVLNPETLADDTDPDYLFRYLDIAAVGRGLVREQPKVMTFGDAPSRARRVLKPGDTIISTVRTYLRSAWTVPDGVNNLVGSTGFACLRPNSSVDPRFLGWIAQSDVVIEEIVARSVGVSYPAINPNEIGRLQIPQLSLGAQLAIAGYLDREVPRLDTIISVRERGLRLIEEHEEAQVHELTCRGLQKTQMRDSRVDWISEIPAHWQTMQIRRIANVRRGASPRPIDDPVYFDDDGAYAWVRISDVTASDRYLTATTQRLSGLGSSLSAKLSPDTLFVSIAASVGKPMVTKIKCCVHDGFVYFKDLRVRADYLYYLFTASQLFRGLGKLGTQLNLNTETIGSIVIPVPPAAEQDGIVSMLDRLRRRSMELRRAQHRHIEVLRERRQALITAAVTGQLDIPEAA